MLLRSAPFLPLMLFPAKFPALQEKTFDLFSMFVHYSVCACCCFPRWINIEGNGAGGAELLWDKYRSVRTRIYTNSMSHELLFFLLPLTLFSASSSPSCDTIKEDLMPLMMMFSVTDGDRWCCSFHSKSRRMPSTHHLHATSSPCLVPRFTQANSDDSTRIQVYANAIVRSRFPWIIQLDLVTLFFQGDSLMKPLMETNTFSFLCRPSVERFGSGWWRLRLLRWRLHQTERLPVRFSLARVLFRPGVLVGCRRRGGPTSIPRLPSRGRRQLDRKSPISFSFLLK